MANVTNGSISEALRHMALSGIQVDILDSTVITQDENLQKLLDTHFLINQEQVGKKVRLYLWRYT